jgi:hypothetical protein
MSFLLVSMSIFMTALELTLSKISDQRKPPKRDRSIPEKLPSHFGFCARPSFSFKKEKSVFLGCSALWCRAAGLPAYLYLTIISKL